MKKEKIKKPFYKRTWFIVLAAMCVLGGVMNLMGYGDDPSKTAQTNEPTITSKADTSESSVASSVQPEQPVSQEQTASEEKPETDAHGFTYDDHINMSISKQILDKYLTGYKAPWGERDWTFAAFDDQGVVMVGTDLGLKDTSMSISKQILDKYLTGYKAPWGERDWTFAAFDDQGVVMVGTDLGLKDTSMKQKTYCIFKYDATDPEKVMFTEHFTAVGDTVLYDDGYCDEFFANLNSLVDQANQ